MVSRNRAMATGLPGGLCGIQNCPDVRQLDVPVAFGSPCALDLNEAGSVRLRPTLNKVPSALQSDIDDGDGTDQIAWNIDGVSKPS
jgi:hypothetical protein